MIQRMSVVASNIACYRLTAVCLSMYSFATEQVGVFVYLLCKVKKQYLPILNAVHTTFTLDVLANLPQIEKVL